MSCQVCALWHQETAILPGDVCEAVENVRSINAGRRQGTCQACRLTGCGAVVKCNYGHCQVGAHRDALEAVDELLEHIAACVLNPLGGG